MAWPPAQGTTAYIAHGSPTTIAWGTDGILGTMIVKSVRSSRMIEEIKIENGSGLTATQVMLYDGDQVEITVVDDRSVTTFPDAMGVISLINPIKPGSSLGTVESFQVINSDYNAARKQEGERVILAKRYNLFSAQSGTTLPDLL